MGKNKNISFTDKSYIYKVLNYLFEFILLKKFKDILYFNVLFNQTS